MFEYLTDAKGRVKGVVILIEIWQRVFPETPKTLEEFEDILEAYVLNRAMDEAIDSESLSLDEALTYLETGES